MTASETREDRLNFQYAFKNGLISHSMTYNQFLKEKNTIKGLLKWKL